MTRRNPRAKWVLPDVIDPPDHICFTVKVPNNRFHIAAFRGALIMLSSAIFWQDDPAHTAKKVALVWRPIIDDLMPGDCDCPSPASVGALEDDMSFFRIVCEQGKSYLEFQSCPDEWVRLANVDQLTNGTQPGDGSPQPPAGGGTQQYCSKLLANGTLLIPTTVNTGDTITIDSATGAGNDAGSVSWFCPDGSFFFAGACAGGGAPASGDPVPSQKHMSLIIGIGSTFYGATIGTPFTVPSGIINGQAFIQVNDDDLPDNSGSYNVCVTVKNNAAATWHQHFDFTLNDGGWQPVVSSGNTLSVWQPGQGWNLVCSGGGTGCGNSQIVRLFPSANIVRIVGVLSSDGSPDGGQNAAIGYNSNAGSLGTFYVSDPTVAQAPGGTLDHSASITTTGIGLGCDQLNATNLLWKSCDVYGTGVNPFL